MPVDTTFPLYHIPPSHRRRGATTVFGQNRHHRSDTASSFFHSFPLPVTHVFFFAVLLRNQGRITAEPRRCDCGHGDPIELPLRFDGGATAITGGRAAVLAVALRGQGGSMTSARRLNMGCGFRSYYRFRHCRGRCYYPRHT